MSKEPFANRITRRQLLGAAAAIGAGGFLLRGGGGAKPARAAPLDALHHLVWVWQFSTDAEPNIIGEKLRDSDLGIILKTHDGVTWMSEYDTSEYAVSGPDQIQTLAEYFEDAEVPFHTWCVVHGSDPIKEARMAAAAALSGARSVYLDVEPHSGFWQGTPDDAARFGEEFRRLAPDAHVAISIDPRPWVLDSIPMTEFAAFANSLAPQNYWRTFNNTANHDRFVQSQFPPPAEGVTPYFLLTTSHSFLEKYGLPIVQVGQGDTPDKEDWEDFINGVHAGGGNYVTVWRYGVMPDHVFDVLKAMPAKQPVVPTPPVVAAAAAPAPSGGGTYVVQPGDSLGLIAANHGTTVEALVSQNGLSDPNVLSVGQELVIPGSGGTVATVSNQSAPAASQQTASTQSYVVQDGDTLYDIAGRFGTTANAIANLNGLGDMDYLYIGQELLIA